MFTRIKEETTQINNLEDLLQSTIKGKIVKHEVQPLTKFGENFGSEILKVSITVEENGQEKVVDAVGKLTPPSQMQLDIFNTQVTFKNEIGFYTDIVPALQDIQREYGMEPIDNFPELYGARISLDASSDVVDNDAVLLLENMHVSGYQNINRLMGFDLNSAKLILQALAEFQATAVALIVKKPEVFNSKVRLHLAELKTPIPPLNLDNVLTENPNTSHLLPKIRKLLLKKRFKKIRAQWATVIHTDLWVNNILVKESTSGTLENLKFVDFQGVDYGSPAIDLLFFLLSSVQTSVLRYHFDKLLQHYYKEFVDVLKRFKINTNEYTYESFQEEIKLEASYEIKHTLMMLFVIFGPKGKLKMPGKVQQWNPNNEVGTTNGHAGPQGNGIKNGGPDMKKNSQPPEFPAFPMPVAMKEKIWFIVEEAEKRKWI